MSNSKRVFVVHGRNRAARDAMFDFLRTIQVHPMEWEEAIKLTGKGSPYVGDVLDVAFANAQAVVVLMTPDDNSYLRETFAESPNDPACEVAGQARPNVLFEAGMALGRNEERTILVEMGDLRSFSDIHGRHSIRMDGSPEKRNALVQRLGSAGVDTVSIGQDWLSAGNFDVQFGANENLPVGKKRPSAKATEPSADGAWIPSGSNKFDTVRVTNIGGQDLYDVLLSVPEDLKNVVTLHDDNPVPRLPTGKAFTIHGHTTRRYMGGPRCPATIELPVTAKLADGTDFQQMIFFNVDG